MKKLFIAVLALSALVACNKDEVVQINSSSAIQFEQAFVDNATRAAQDPSFTNGVGDANELKAFSVWGFMDKVGGDVFNEELVSKQGDHNWTYVNTQYWLPEHTYYFAALAPANAKNVKVTVATADVNEEKPENGGLQYGLGKVEFQNIDGKTDLLYDAKAVSTKEYVIGEEMPKVSFHLGHLLAKTKFTFKNGFVNPNNKLVVKNIKMIVPGEGEINLATNNWWMDETTPTWTLGASTTTLEYGHMANGEKVGAGETTECDYERLTIPAGADQEYKVTFDVVLYNGTEEAYSRSLSTTITGTPMRMGYAYNFVAELNETNIAEAELKPIVFCVNEVKGWENVEYKDSEGVIDTEVASVSSAKELQDALNAGATNFRLVSDIKEELSFGTPDVKSAAEAVAAPKEFTLDLNGNNITVTGDAIVVDYGVKLTISGKGTVTAGQNASGNAVWVKHGNVVINGGTYVVGNDPKAADNRNDCIYVGASAYVDDAAIKVSSATIYNGVFEAAADNNKGQSWVLNINDKFAQNGSEIIVYGGEFKDFNPAEGNTESPAMNFVAKDYGVEVSTDAEATWYTVKELPNVNINVAAGETQTLISNVISNGAAAVAGTLDGAGYTLFSADVPSTDAVIKPSGDVVIKNLNIDGGNRRDSKNRALRAFYTTNGTLEKLTIDNVKITGTGYSLNLQKSTAVLKVTNSTFEGWTSYSSTIEASFENVKFTTGNYFSKTENNGFFRPYGNTTLKNCEFDLGFIVSFTEVKTGEKITFSDCKYNGTVLTKDNIPATWEKFQEAINAGLIVFENTAE